MASVKPKTYAEQVQVLQKEASQKDDLIAKLRTDLSLLPELQQELQHHREAANAASVKDVKGNQALRVQLNDAQQQVTETAGRLKGAHATIKSFEHKVAELEDRLRDADPSAVRAPLEKQINLMQEELTRVRAENTAISRQATQAVNDAQAQVETMSGELRTLRMNLQGYQRQLAETQQNAKGQVAAAQTSMEQMAGELRVLRMRDQANTRMIQEIRAAIDGAPDVLGNLRNLLSRQ
jgi:chromosome segregation ATPase